MNLRQKKPEIALPNTVISKAHFLDNVFGPANYTPDIASGSTTQWTSGLGKKFIDGRTEMGLAGIFETGMGISNNDVTFFASLIDEYRPGITLGRSQVKESKPDLGGKSQTDSLTAEMKRSWFKDRNFALQKQELSGSTFYIMDQKTLDPPTNISGQISLVISRSEYDGIAIPTNMDTSIHTPLLSFESFDMESDNNDVPYRKAALKVNGVSGSGTMASGSLGLDMLTFNYDTLNTEAAGNVVDLQEAENGILTVDEFIEALKVVEYQYQEYDGLIETCTRLRVHYYGGARDLPNDWFFMDVSKGKIFDNTLPLSNYFTSGYTSRYRKLYRDNLPNKIYNQLTANPKENSVHDNPSPYLLEGSDTIDLGQILYGFESIFYQHHVPLSGLFPPPVDSYSPSYENFPVRIVNDLAGWLANITIPAVEYFYFLKTGDILHDDVPDLNTLQGFYEYSAPNADLFGNADSIGIWWAYQILLEANAPEDLKLSDVFTLYYLGVSQLRPEINPPLQNPIHPFYTSDNRWKIFSLFFGFMELDGGGGYVWIRDNDTEWAIVKGSNSADPMGRDYDNRLFHFSTFWYNRLIGPLHSKRLAWDLLWNIEYPISAIILFKNIGFFDNTNQNEREFILDQILICFESKFLNFVEARL